jgi:flagellin
MVSISTNSSAAQALQSLNANNQALSETQKRVSTGLKVASAKDDASTYSIAQNMRAQTASWKAVENSLSRGQSILDIAAAGASNAQDILQKLREDATSLGDTSLSQQSQDAIRAEMQALIDQLDKSINSATFDGENLLNRTSTSSGGMVSSFQQAGPTLNIHLGQDISMVGGWSPFGVSLVAAWHVADFDGSITNIAIQPFHPSGAGDQHNDWPLSSPLPAGTVYFTYNPASGYYGMAISGAAADPVKVLSTPSGGSIDLGAWDLRSTATGLDSLNWSDPQAILDAVNNAHQTIIRTQQAIGAKQNLLDASVNAANSQQDQLTQGVGNLVDADMGKEGAKLQAAQIKQQLATSSLSIANQQPQYVLNLFK